MKELYGNGYVPSIAQAIEEMKAEQGESFSPERINLAELERRTGISRGKLRRLKQNGFRGIPKGSDSGKHKFTKLTGYKSVYNMSITEYIQRKRISVAEHMLIQTDLTIAEISRIVGYSNPSRLIEIFKRYYGFTPSKYRK